MWCLILSRGFIILALFTSGSFAYYDDYSCNNTICSPRAGDLLIGRESALYADSTCGLNEVETYCIVSATGKSRCNECYSKQAYNRITNPQSHRIGNIVSRVPSDENRWWQSVNAVHNVSITLNLETQFQFISTILRFKTFRPAAMYLERSNNFGQTWSPYAYFSSNCFRDFPQIPERPRTKLDDVTCSSIYSQLTPSEGGVVAFMAAPSDMHANLDLYSDERQKLTAITNLRATFTRLNTLGDLELDDSAAIKRKYYYALYEWNVWGRCSCFGHATRCKPRSQNEIMNKEKVYGVCECTHFTTGDNCERCADFYQAKPWQPATRGSANACERCECHQHTDMCFFSPLLYLASNNVSGGHCYQCKHNTEGAQCEFCKAGYYRHPSYPINHPKTCESCNCHSGGSKDYEHCEQYTDASQNKIAGRCLCKENVGGDKCDRCQDGYWNFQANNPEGCDECKCYMLGTLHNTGCDQSTGACTCKRLVEGEFCDKCMPGYFNLTASASGCQPCACSNVGATSGNCDSNRGLCECKPGFSGRACDTVEDGYYVKKPEQIVNQLGVTVNIPIEGPKYTGQHVVIVAFEPRNFGPRDQWQVIIIPNQLEGSCRNKNFTLQVTKDTHRFVLPDICFEGDKKTVISVHPDRRYGDPYAEIVIDDIIIKPDDGDAGYIGDYCEQYREVAQEIKDGISDPSKLPQRCQTYFSTPETHWKDTGAVAVRCECDVTGSVKPECDKMTGQCFCKPGVMGRTCDQCQHYHYNFGASGCTACDCDAMGSVNPQCDVLTSLCSCRPNIEGRKCDRCSPGHWDFPYCRRCECNGRSDLCDPVTGKCLNCSENTGGTHCGRCAQGYFGDPLRGEPCRPCECPGGGVDHSDGCSLHPIAGMACHCKRGYSGAKCSECSPNYFGNPTDLGGSCQPCDCSGNLPPQGGCDPTTGTCLTCLHNTEGERCHLCIAGFWGNATQQICRSCSCHPMGSRKNPDGSDSTCDRFTGVCQCLPNVMGPRCFSCALNHFNLSSGLGCEPCGCDSTGSLHLACHPQTGACTCKSDRGGRRCDQCQRSYFGDPNSPEGCQPCNCDRRGSLSDTCDPKTGQCVCRPGIAGRSCDQCARGTTGYLPNCQHCGECWTNWDDAISELVDKMNELEHQTSSQFPSDLKPIYDILHALVSQIELLPDSGLTADQLTGLEKTLEQAEKLIDKIGGRTGQLADAEAALKRLENEQEKVENKLSSNLEYLERLSDDLNLMIYESKNASVTNPFSAYQVLKHAYEQAKKIVARQQDLEHRKPLIDRLFQETADGVADRQHADDEFERRLKPLVRNITNLQAEIRQLNRAICGDNQQPPGSDADSQTCPSACGGASCDAVSSNVFNLKDHQSSMKIPYEIAMPPESFGVFSGCAGPKGCESSSEAKLRELLQKYLGTENYLASVLLRSARVDDVFSNVTSSHNETEAMLRTIADQLNLVTSRVERAQNITDTLIQEATEIRDKYRKLTLARYNELVDRIRNLEHTTNLYEATRLGRELQQLAEALKDKVNRILAETAGQKAEADDLLASAEQINNRTQSILKQVNELNEMNKAFDEMEKNPITKLLDEKEFHTNQEKVEDTLSELEAFQKRTADEYTKKADQAKQNKAAATRLQEEVQMSNTLGLQSLQELGSLNPSFIQLDEQMKALDAEMDKIADKGPDTDQRPSESPSELAEEVKAYIANLTASLKEVEDLEAPMKKMEDELRVLAAQMPNMVNTLEELSKKLSYRTKFQRLCS